MLDVHLGPGPNAERLADAWARERGLAGIAGAKTLWARWQATVNRSLNHAPPRTSALWNRSEWRELAEAFAPEAAGAEEKQLLGELLLSSDERQLGALPNLWRLQENYESGTLQEEALHTDLEQHAPAYGALVEAIRTYEAFARGLQDGSGKMKRTPHHLARPWTASLAHGCPAAVNPLRGSSTSFRPYG